MAYVVVGGDNRLIIIIDKWPSYKLRELAPLHLMDAIYQHSNGGGWGKIEPLHLFRLSPSVKVQALVYQR